jgi:anti-sigma regulatory factor (Ser/Thr protein kinase)
MAERINLEMPATLSALSTLRMIMGGLGVRLDFSLDDLDDLYLATGELLRTALADDGPDRLSVEVEVDQGSLRFVAGAFSSARLRSEVTVHDETCLDLCMLLRRTVDEVTLEDVGDEYRVVLVKRRSGGSA